MTVSRRDALGTAGIGLLAAASAQAQDSKATPEAIRGNTGATIIGPRNPSREAQNPDLVVPPSTDKGTLPNLRFSFADAHTRLDEGGWARQVTARELAISKAMAGVNMRLKAGAVREMHWHKEAEWSYMIKGSARVTSVDQDGRFFIGDVGEGDLWYFPSGLPHSIQGTGADGCEFLLVFDSGDCSEDSTFLLTDWMAHVPRSVLAKNFGVAESAFANIPKEELYIFQSSPPPVDIKADTPAGVGAVPQGFTHRMMAQEPVRTRGGTVRITDTRTFPASATISAALVELEPGGLRELHWHTNGDEWQYYLEGTGRMGVFASQASARTFDFDAGDVGYVPFAMGHYIENTGSTPLRFLEVFRSPRYADVSLTQWLALSPPELVQAHLHLANGVVAGLPKAKAPVVPRG